MSAGMSAWLRDRALARSVGPGRAEDTERETVLRPGSERRSKIMATLEETFDDGSIKRTEFSSDGLVTEQVNPVLVVEAPAALSALALADAIVQLGKVEQLDAFARDLKALAAEHPATVLHKLVECLVGARRAALLCDDGREAHAACEVALRSLLAVAADAMRRSL